MKKFCCNSFQFHWEAKKEMGLNFRIIKLSAAFIKRGYMGTNVYRYLITEGYSTFTDQTKSIVMEFCPYCGKELKKIYHSDDYVNEAHHEY